MLPDPSRHDEPCCRYCKYSLIASTDRSNCPECGAPITLALHAVPFSEWDNELRQRILTLLRLLAWQGGLFTVFLVTLLINDILASPGIQAIVTWSLMSVVSIPTVYFALRVSKEMKHFTGTMGPWFQILQVFTGRIKLFAACVVLIFMSALFAGVLADRNTLFIFCLVSPLLILPVMADILNVALVTDTIRRHISMDSHCGRRWLSPDSITAVAAFALIAAIAPRNDVLDAIYFVVMMLSLLWVIVHFVPASLWFRNRTAGTMTS